MLAISRLISQNVQELADDLPRRKRRDFQLYRFDPLLFLQSLFDFRVGALKKNRGPLPSQIEDSIAPRFHSQSVAQVNRKSFGNAERNSMRQQQSIDDLCFITRPYLDLVRGQPRFLEPGFLEHRKRSIHLLSAVP